MFHLAMMILKKQSLDRNLLEFFSTFIRLHPYQYLFTSLIISLEHSNRDTNNYSIGNDYIVPKIISVLKIDSF